MKIAIIGTGYVGLVSGVCFAAKGHSVICVDNDPHVVAVLNAGRPHIYEAGLEALLTKVQQAGRFTVTQDLRGALQHVELVMIAVGTPSVSGVIDLAYVEAAARSIGEYLKETDQSLSVVVKSTVVPGTTDTVVRRVIQNASGRAVPQFGLGMNPEFLREGDAIDDFDNPDRIVLGYEDEATLERLERLYEPWPVEKLRVNTRTAELIKYANNALLATQISAVNEIANMAAALGGIDVMDVVQGVQLDKRWNPLLEDGQRAQPGILSYLIPGCGFGGSCFPKDVQALRSQGQRLGLPMALLEAVLTVNDAQPAQVVEILDRAVPDLSTKRVLVLGLAFKPGTDDVREAASLKIVRGLLSKAGRVVGHDPVATERFRQALSDVADSVTFASSWRDEVASADVIIVAVAWQEYQALLDHDLSGKVLFDARRVFSPQKVRGARYLSIGWRTV